MQEFDFSTQLNTEKLSALQLKRLQQSVTWAYERSRFYREKFEMHQILPADIRMLSDIKKLPFTEKRDFFQHSPYDFLTLPLSGVVRINMSNDIVGLVKMYTKRDVATNISLNFDALQATGINRASVVAMLLDNKQNSLVDVQSALEGIGAAVVPLDIEHEEFLRLFDMLGVDTIVGTPKKVIKMIVQLQAMGRDVLELQFQRIVCVNDALHNPLKVYLRQRVNTKVYNIFTSSEIGFNGIIYQCEEYLSQHFREDFFYPEIVAFGSDEVIEDTARMGELVITTLAAEAMPIIRYRTGQAVQRIKEGCSCGNLLPCFRTPL